MKTIELIGVGVSLNASSTAIAETAFDNVVVRESTTPAGATVPMVDFKLGDKVVATLGVSGLSYATLRDDGDKPVGEAVGIERGKRKAFTPPTKGGTIKSVAKDVSPIIAALSSKESMTKQQMEFLNKLKTGAQKLFQPVISGWKGADFVAA
jgi:hypothetical protein